MARPTPRQWAVSLLLVSLAATAGAVPGPATANDETVTGAVIYRPNSDALIDAEPSPVEGHSNGSYVTLAVAGWAFFFHSTDASPMPTGTYDWQTVLPSGGSPTLSITNSSTACQGEGWKASILESAEFAADGTLTRFAADVYHPCGTKPTIASIRLNSVFGTRAIRATRAIDFPDTVAGDESPVQSMVVENLGSDALPLEPVGISGSHPSDFLVENDACSGVLLEPDTTCAVDVSFVPTSSTSRSASLVVSSAELVTAAQTIARGTGLSPTTDLPVRLATSSDAGEWVGDGDASVLPETTMVASHEGYAVDGETPLVVIYSPNPDELPRWSFRFSAPDGEILTTGRYAVPSEGTLNASGFGHGCNWTTGHFEILESPGFDEDGDLVSFSADFEQHCEGAAARLRGSIRLHSQLPLTDFVPPSGSVEINGGDATTDDARVTVSIPAEDPSGLASIALSTDGSSWSTRAYAASVPVDLPPGDGVKEVSVRWRDGAGNWTSPKSDTIVLDTAGDPGETAGSVSIEGGDAYTRLQTVNVSTSGPGGGDMAAVALSNDGNQWSELDDATSHVWTLSAGDGVKTVYAKWLESDGTWSAVSSDEIILDTGAPLGSVQVHGGASFATTPTVSVAVEAEDAGSGVTHVALSNDGISWTTRLYGGVQSWSLGPSQGTRTVYAKWRDAAGNWSGVATDELVLDSTAPTSSAPRARLVTGASVDGGRLQVRLSWDGSDATSGVDHFELEQSVDGGDWSAVAADSSTTSLRSLVPRRAYRFRVRAVDAAGNVGSWATSTSLSLARYQEGSARIRYRGTWRKVSGPTYWAGAARYASIRGARATLTFSGRSVAWVSRTGPTRGKAAVYVNGTRVATVDLFSPTAGPRLIVWSAAWTSSASRTVTVRVLGTSGRPRVELDAFVTGS